MSDDQKISVSRHPCCFTRDSNPHRFNCPEKGLMAVQMRVERTDDCCPDHEGAYHSPECTSNEAVLSRVNLEEARLDKMAKAAEHRMLHGNPLDRLKHLVDTGQISAEQEQVDGGMFIRFTSNVVPGVETRYGPLSEQNVYEEAFRHPSNVPDPPTLAPVVRTSKIADGAVTRGSWPMVGQIAGKDYSHKPRIRIPVQPYRRKIPRWRLDLARFLLRLANKVAGL